MKHDGGCFWAKTLTGVVKRLNSRSASGSALYITARTPADYRCSQTRGGAAQHPIDAKGGRCQVSAMAAPSGAAVARIPLRNVLESGLHLPCLGGIAAAATPPQSVTMRCGKDRSLLVNNTAANEQPDNAFDMERLIWSTAAQLAAAIPCWTGSAGKASHCRHECPGCLIP